MKNCNIVKDLMPLVAENIASEESSNLVKKHIETCSECKIVWDSINDNEYTDAFESEAIPIKNARDKIDTYRKKSNIVIGLLITYILLIIFQFLTRPVLLPADKAILDFEIKGEDIVLTLSSEVAGISLSGMESDPDNKKEGYSLMAWTNRINKYMPNRSEAKYLIENPKSKLIYYISDNDVDIILGEHNKSSNRATLPRLALSYYLKLAGFVFLITAIIAVLTKVKWFKYLTIFSFSYVITHFMVLGIKAATYQMTKDFLIILVLSIILSTVLIIFYKQRKTV